MSRHFNRAGPWHEIARVYREPMTRSIAVSRRGRDLRLWPLESSLDAAA